jgi:hypothetical protein
VTVTATGSADVEEAGAGKFRVGVPTGCRIDAHAGAAARIRQSWARAASSPASLSPCLLARVRALMPGPHIAGSCGLSYGQWDPPSRW